LHIILYYGVIPSKYVNTVFTPAIVVVVVVLGGKSVVVVVVTAGSS
jgi:hypothetical protein